jgi:putative endonuclease
MARRFHNFGSMQSLFAPGGTGLSADTGSLGEIRAAGYLRRVQGFQIVARNWRNPRDRRQEIDLVGRDRGALVFVEVKTRARGSLVPGFHAVDSRKKSALRRAIRAYLSLIRSKPRTFRFDIVEVEAGGGIRHFRNVGLFSKHYRP